MDAATEASRSQMMGILMTILVPVWQCLSLRMAIRWSLVPTELRLKKEPTVAVPVYSQMQLTVNGCSKQRFYQMMDLLTTFLVERGSVS